MCVLHMLEEQKEFIGLGTTNFPETSLSAVRGDVTDARNTARAQIPKALFCIAEP